MGTELTECNNLRMQPRNTFIIRYFPSCVGVSASDNIRHLSVHTQFITSTVFSYVHMYKRSGNFDLSKLLDKFYIIIIYEFFAQNIKILRVKFVRITKCCEYFL